MKADTGTLMALCEKTDNDIRSCINTLQVREMCAQKHGRIKIEMGLLMLIGKKMGLLMFVCAVFTQSWTEALRSAQCQFSLRGIERPKQGTFHSLAGNLSASSTEKVLQNKICNTQAHALFTQPSLLNL